MSLLYFYNINNIEYSLLAHFVGTQYLNTYSEVSYNNLDGEYDFYLVNKFK